MQTRETHCWHHGRVLTSTGATRSERNTWAVIVLTVVMMAIEVGAGMAYGSMALLADGWHMGSHAAALGITAFSYWYARRNAENRRFTFGTGKVGALGGFASAVALAIVALLMLVECVERLFSPVPIRFSEALIVAAIGLVVNLASAWMLHVPHDEHEEHGHDHNQQAAFFHVLADGLTSGLAILALLAGRQFGWNGLDPAIGIVGSLIIARWAWRLVRQASRVLLDADVDPGSFEAIRRRIEVDTGDRVVDLHVWRIAPNRLAALVSVVTHDAREPEFFKGKLEGIPELVHVTVEVNRCEELRPQAI